VHPRARMMAIVLEPKTESQKPRRKEQKKRENEGKWYRYSYIGVPMPYLASWTLKQIITLYQLAIKNGWQTETEVVLESVKYSARRADVSHVIE